MPVGFNSPARNLFLLGSTGAQVVTNFFQRIDQSAGTDGVYLPDEIKYNVPDQKFLLAGSNQTSASKGKGWFEKRTAAGSRDWSVEVTSTLSNTNTTLTSLEIDSLNNLIVCGKTGIVPWIAKYTNDGEISWQITSNTSDINYTGIAVDSNNNIYACGSDSGIPPFVGPLAFIEKIGSTGTYSWGKSSSTTAGSISLVKCDANNRGEVVAVGKIEDTIKDKGYIAKVNTATGDLLWDRTIEDPRLATSSSYWQTECTDVYIDSKEQIYVVGTIRDTIGNLSKGFLIKYSPEGNIVWQKETKLDRNFEFYAVKSDGETQQTIVLGRFTHSNDDFLFLNKYSQDGTLLWTRTLYSSLDQTISNVSLDADTSFYYLLFTDETTNLVSGEPDTYTFGKVSTSGNGFGAFQYSSGGINYNYAILNITDNVGRLTDGSVRNDASDFITYPFEANKILFDDLATQVANKKVQVDEAGTYAVGPTYNITTGYPKISTQDIITDGLVFYIEPSVSYQSPRTGNTLYDLSSGNRNATLVNSPTYSSSNGGYLVFDGTNKYATVAANSAWGFGANGSVEMWVYVAGNSNSNDRFFNTNNNTSSLDAYLNGSTYNVYFHGSSFGTTSPIPQNTWVHFVVRYISGAVTVYFNNSAQGLTGTTTGYNITTTSTLYIASFNSPGYELNGRIGAMRIYNKGLSASEVSHNFNASRARYGV